MTGPALFAVCCEVLLQVSYLPTLPLELQLKVLTLTGPWAAFQLTHFRTSLGIASLRPGLQARQCWLQSPLVPGQRDRWIPLSLPGHRGGREGLAFRVQRRAVWQMLMKACAS